MKVTLKALSPGYEAVIKADLKRIESTAMRTFREAGKIIKEQGRASIAQGGFGGRWQSALRVTVYPEDGQSGSPAIFVKHKIPYAGVFEKGATISGKRLLWIPLSNGPMGSGGRRMTPEQFEKNIGPLYLVKRGGKPMLAAVIRSTDTRAAKAVSLSQLRRGRNPKGRGKVRLVPLYVGVSTVNISKRFDIGGVVNRVRGALAEIYSGIWGN